MADQAEKIAKKPYQLLADAMVIDATTYKRGDTVHLDPAHADRLAETRSVGAVGGLEKLLKATDQAMQVMAEAEADLARNLHEEVTLGHPEIPISPAGAPVRRVQR